MTEDELKQLIASNARVIEAATAERAELRQAVLRLEQVFEQLASLNSGMIRLLASLDEERPTILRKLTVLEQKVDQLLEEKEN